jgi:hypothetical protein
LDEQRGGAWGATPAVDGRGGGAGAASAGGEPRLDEQHALSEVVAIDSDVAAGSGGRGASAAAAKEEDAVLAAVDAATRPGGGEWADPEADAAWSGPASPPPLGRCKIYILDASQEIAPGLGIPACNVSQAWPFDRAGAGVEGLSRTPHWAAEHASGYWVAQAIANGPHYTKFLREADLVYVYT